MTRLAFASSLLLIVVAAPLALAQTKAPARSAARAE